MKKIRLTESELINLIEKVVIKEQDEGGESRDYPVGADKYDEKFQEIYEHMDEILDFVELKLGYSGIQRL